LYCIRCGACLNACPVYSKVGGHAYGWVYPGPIGAVVTPSLVGVPIAKDLPFASTLCGACREVCPLNIDLPRMLLKLRSDANEGPKGTKKANRVESMVMRGWRMAVSGPRMFTMAGKVAAILQWPLSRNRFLRRLPPPLSGWTKSRDFPKVAAKPFRSRWAAMALPPRKEGSDGD
ncbi:MAG: lactate utilization protein, partial [Chloroflexi bacterium]|nr:lactate utilization protein [Chloroflexota bacterium]